MIDHRIEGASAWRRPDIRTEDYRVVLDGPCLDEIRRVADEIRTYPLPTILRTPADFDMTNCHAAMAEVRRILKQGVRFAVVDRLPLEELSADEAQCIYWLLSSMVARPVAQKLDGTMIYDVHDTGAQALPGSGIRPDKTNIEIRFHIDNAYNTTPPEIVGLLCLKTAKSGGTSRVLSFHTVHNTLLERHKELLPRLYRPFWFDRQKEFFPGEVETFFAPIFEDGEELRSRFSVHQINGGYALKGEPLDNEGAAALAATSRFSRSRKSRWISNSRPAKSSLSTTARWATAAPSSRTTPSPNAAGTSSASGYATTAAVPIRGKAQFSSRPPPRRIASP